MTVDDIIQTIRDHHGGAWWGVFHVVEGGHKFLPTGHVLTPAAYKAVRAQFSPKLEAGPLTDAERKRNIVRGRSDATARDAAGE